MDMVNSLELLDSEFEKFQTIIDSISKNSKKMIPDIVSLYFQATMVETLSKKLRQDIVESDQQKYLEKINTISESKIDLNSIKREKLSSFQFTELSMFNQNDTETSSFNVGDDFSIKLKYTFKDQNLVGSNLQVKISLNNSTQTEVLNLNNEVTGFIHKLKSSSGEIICEIPKMPLGEGTYSISIQATINSGVSDILKEICSFEIIPGDYFGTGIANITKSNYYCKSNWK